VVAVGKPGMQEALQPTSFRTGRGLEKVRAPGTGTATGAVRRVP
jgi:hypothetical protein